MAKFPKAPAELIALVHRHNDKYLKTSEGARAA